MDDHQPPVLASVPPSRIDSPRKPDWAIVLLGRVQHGDTVDQARKRRGSLVSTDTIQRYAHIDPEWWLALMDAQDGTVRGEPVGDLELARANGYEEEERRHKLAMEAGEKYAHPYMRLGAEIRGRVGQGAQASASAAARVTIIMAQVPGGPPVGRVVESSATEAPAPDTGAAPPSG